MAGAKPRLTTGIEIGLRDGARCSLQEAFAIQSNPALREANPPVHLVINRSNSSNFRSHMPVALYCGMLADD